MSARNTAVRRLRKEYQALQQQPEFGFVAAPVETNVLEWHFVLFGSADTPYQGGLYHGRLIFPSTYPMSPPAVYMRTESGRFKVDTKICMSMSDFHPEEWNPMWGVRLILIGMLSFMNSEEPSTGAITAVSSPERVMIAQRSLTDIKNDRIVLELFPDVLSQADSNLEYMSTWPPPPLPVPPVTNIPSCVSTTIINATNDGSEKAVAVSAQQHNSAIVATAAAAASTNAERSDTDANSDATTAAGPAVGTAKSKSAKNNARRRAKAKAAKLSSPSLTEPQQAAEEEEEEEEM